MKKNIMRYAFWILIVYLLIQLINPDLAHPINLAVGNFTQDMSGLVKIVTP